MSDSLADPKPGSGEGALDPGLKRRFQKQPKRVFDPICFFDFCFFSGVQ